MRKTLFHWGVLAASCVLALGLLMSLSVTWVPLINAGDPYNLLRYLVLRLTAIAIAAPALTGLMIFVDFVTPGDWMKAIGDDPKACSLVMSAVILVIGAVLCWT